MYDRIIAVVNIILTVDDDTGLYHGFAHTIIHITNNTRE